MCKTVTSFPVFILPIFLLLPLTLTPAYAADFTGQVVSVKDGDTIEVLHTKKAERIRLAGIDCPEKKQAFGQRAKQATSSLGFGQNVTIQRTGKDRYGRTLGTEVLPNSRNLNHELVKDRWC